MIAMAREVVAINEEVVVAIELPKLAVNNVKMFVTEVGRDSVDVVLLFEQLDDAEQVGPPKFR